MISAIIKLFGKPGWGDLSRKLRSFVSFVGFLFVIALQASCGGGVSASPGDNTGTGAAGGDTSQSPGNSDAGPVASTLTFPVKIGYRSFPDTASVVDYKISGTCVGTARTIRSAAYSESFDSVDATAVKSSVSIDWQGCKPLHVSSSAIYYYDANNAPLGVKFSSGGYGVYQFPPSTLESVKVGDSGAIATLNIYTNSSQTFLDGHDDITFEVEPDTATSAIINTIDKNYDLSGNLIFTKQQRSRIMADGAMFFISSDVIYTDSPATHLIWTVVPDTTPPTLVTAYPPSHSESAGISTTVMVTFSEMVDPATVTNATFTLTDGVTSVPGTVTSSEDSATFTPSSPLTPSTVYTATITSGVKDFAGNGIGKSFSWQFKTVSQDLTPPTVLSTNPAADQTSVAIGTSVNVAFSEPMDAATVTNGGFTLSNGATSIPGYVACSGTTATLKPGSLLEYNTVYTATIGPGVKDLAGNFITSTYSWSFKTGVEPDIVPPTVSSVSPASDFNGAALANPIADIFSGPISSVSASSASFSLISTRSQ